MTTTNTQTVLATESITDTNWGHLGKALALGTLIGAVVLALISRVKAASGPDGFGGLGDLVSSAAYSLTNSMFLVAMLLIPMMVIPGLPGARYLTRTLVRFDVLVDGVEARGSDGALLGSTADGSLRVTNVNLRATNGLHGGLCVEHRGGKVLLSPTPSIGAYPGQAAEVGRWFGIKTPLVEALRRFAA